MQQWMVKFNNGRKQQNSHDYFPAVDGVAAGPTILYIHIHKISIGFLNLLDTVDGQNPAPPRMMIIPLFIGLKVLTIPGGCLGFLPSTVVSSWPNPN